MTCEANLGGGGGGTAGGVGVDPDNGEIVILGDFEGEIDLATG